ncbi:sugar diacid utilization regulator [Paenibacillus shirakamiensis]|uniref:Sugar diacid utilization regulator n=1 Tax=Paenibacillus shirakamiensis TaxID=1265935 RepID=A0ABS4JJW3_9BACL|nr:helix-turn-helix domain-containing protein [Paenibacillus shirakamiensis]MBP2001400.1 sugar diacid utilization regulator [Paenibacillus shirakamiensis]
MDMNLLQTRLEDIVGFKIELKTMSIQEWQIKIQDNKELSDSSFCIEDRIYFAFQITSSDVQYFEVGITQLSNMERKLIELLIMTSLSVSEVKQSKAEGDSRDVELGKWLQEQWELGNQGQEIPDSFGLRNTLSETMVPFLLSYENRIQPEITYSSLNKLMKSYFDGDVVLIPLLNKEWLILANENSLDGLREESEAGAQAEHDMLSALCQGLYELISNEWVGVCHLSVTEPIIPISSLLDATSVMKATIQLGRLFHVTEHIHLPWEVHLERLIYSIPDEERRQFLEQTITQSNTTSFTDQETLTTLETFFQLDCNVSETAKRLYIHRNTLLYRMDKLKQETGLDVRSFKDAVLVKLTLLLYKVTKRK